MEIDTTLPAFLDRRLSVTERDNEWARYRTTWTPAPRRAPTRDEIETDEWWRALREARAEDARLAALTERRQQLLDAEKAAAAIAKLRAAEAAQSPEERAAARARSNVRRKAKRRARNETIATTTAFQVKGATVRKRRKAA